MVVEIAKVCGLCAGATKALNEARSKINEGKKVVLYKELLHNPLVMEGLLKYATLKEKLEDLTKDDYVIIRAHGEPKKTYDYLKTNGIEYSDCICPNVKNIQNLIFEKNNENYKIIIIGKYGKGVKPMHPEVYGLCGWCDEPILIQDESDFVNLKNDKSDKYFVVCQTTFPMDKAEILFLEIEKIINENGKLVEIRNTICNGQKLINESSVALAENSDLMIVVGGRHSSNSVELFNNVSKYTKSIFIEKAEELDLALNEINLSVIPSSFRIGLTAGASTEKTILENIKEILLSKGEIC